MAGKRAREVRPVHTVAELGETLAWATTPATPPPIGTFEGRTVTWEPWEVAVKILCHRKIPEDRCDVCEYNGQPWIAFGLVDQPPGTVPAQHRQLVAFSCPLCADLAVYDHGPAGDRFEPVQPQDTLF